MRVTLDRDLDALTERIIGTAFEVFKTLGHGFVEAVYKKAFLCELRERCLDAEQEVPFQIGHKGSNVGTCFADIVVARPVIVELKVAEALATPHKRQVINYLRASGLPVGLLFNFGSPSLTFARILP